MKKKMLLLVTIWLQVYASVMAQNYLQGKVLDLNDKPLKEVRVVLSFKNSEMYETKTNDKGEFEIKQDRSYEGKMYSIQLEKSSYTTITTTQRIWTGTTHATPLTFRMRSGFDGADTQINSLLNQLKSIESSTRLIPPECLKKKSMEDIKKLINAAHRRIHEFTLAVNEKKKSMESLKDAIKAENDSLHHIINSIQTFSDKCVDIAKTKTKLKITAPLRCTAFGKDSITFLLSMADNNTEGNAEKVRVQMHLKKIVQTRTRQVVQLLEESKSRKTYQDFVIDPNLELQKLTFHTAHNKENLLTTNSIYEATLIAAGTNDTLSTIRIKKPLEECSYVADERIDGIIKDSLVIDGKYLCFRLAKIHVDTFLTNYSPRIKLKINNQPTLDFYTEDTCTDISSYLKDGSNYLTFSMIDSTYLVNGIRFSLEDKLNRPLKKYEMQTANPPELIKIIKGNVTDTRKKLK